jgi:fatty acid desaturase
MNPGFVPRSELAAYEWREGSKWQRPDIDRDVLRALSQRSTLNGLLRVGLFAALLALAAGATLWVAQYSLPLAVPVLYCYYFLYGFWVAIVHELQHKVVFARSADWFSETLFYFVQTLLWNSPTYARISHKLHHRYTMVHGTDPETAWPEVVTTSWLRRYFWGLLLRILVVGAVWALFQDVLMQVKRALGRKDRMMRDHCSSSDVRRIRLESAGILLFHVAVAAVPLSQGWWALLLFGTIAWQIGVGIEMLWHQTEHIGRMCNVTDQRLCTRSIRVGPFIHLIYWGLDDHVDHHLFPGVPSRNLPKLHAILKDQLPEPKGMLACWKEMFAIARAKDADPSIEYLPCNLP